MAHPSVNPIEEFVVDFVTSFGGEVESLEPAVYNLLLPDDLAIPAPKQELITVAFDPEALTERPQAELLISGSPLLDNLIDVARQQGRVARCFVTGLNLKVHGILHHFKRSFIFHEAEVAVSGTRSLLFLYGLFMFRISYVSDEKEEELCEIIVNCFDGRLARRLSSTLKTTALTEEIWDHCLMARAISVFEAYKIARAEVEKQLVGRINERRLDLEQRLTQQITRLTAYYDTARTELEETLTKYADDQKQQQTIKEKIQANELERQRIMQELRDKHRLEVLVSLTNLLLLSQPKVVVSLEVIGKKKQQNRVSVIWDPLEECFEPVQCPLCHKHTYELAISRMAQVGCPLCIERKNIPRLPL
ncbi:MAG: hypothetical protein QME51_00750 [Planctomycetota bacterium]|nr:hypothetical protein [Planctomycetota bacterium]MDI6786886.1 hypothetical protein [Planctomycetota bacterium]